MTEWGLTPEYILDNWTEELFTLMFVKRAERIEAMTKAVKHDAAPAPVAYKQITDQELFALPWAGGSYKRVIVPKVN
jgi:hypothetical protein